MATRIKDGMIPYTGGIGIEITNNHVINVLLRGLNNLIHVNENRELYVDLQLDDGIQPDDDFPVGVTTGKILQEDGWQQSGIILNWKTTSGDYVRLIYANDGKLYYDPGTGVWIELGAGGLDINVATATQLGTVKLGSDTKQTEAIQTPTATAGRSYAVQLNNDNQAVVNVPWENTEYESLVEEQGGTDESLVTTGEKYIWNHKQDSLTPGTNIVIDQNNVISATIPNVLIYKGNVTSIADLPSSGQTVGDTYFVEGADAMYSWDGTQWNYVGGTGISLTDYFNMTVNTSDDITEGSVHLFVTQTEKNYWNSKQDQLTAGANIQIDSNNVISATDTKYTQGDGIEITAQNVINNTAKFDPDNAGSLGQFLKKTSNGYAWADIPGGGGGTSYTAGDGIDITNNVISATDRFTPTNQGSIGQVLKKSGTNTYYWANESGGQGNFNPENPGTTGQVLTKTATGYDWETISGNANVMLFTLNSELNHTINLQTAQEAYDWLQAGKLPVVRIYGSHDYVDSAGVQHVITGYWDYYPQPSSLNVANKIVFNALPNTFDRVNIFTQYGYSQITDFVTTFTIDDGSVTEVEVTEATNGNTNFLAVGINYSTPYIPQFPGSPATKAYVDSRNWVGTLSEYNAIVTKDPNVFYNITSLS